MFIELSTSAVIDSKHTKCVSLNNSLFNLLLLICILKNTLQVLILGRCAGSGNTLNDLFNKVCVPNKTGDLSLRFSTWIQK